MQQQPQLIGRDICKSFRMGARRIEVLRGISMDIAHNETVFLSGASGAGKTTLLYTLAGLERPESGTVKFEGRELYSGGSSAEARLRNEKMGFVFQGYFLLHELTALENVLLPAMIGSRTTKGEAEESLAAVGLADRMHHLPAELSGGEQQRVAIARALTNDPDIIFADEPTGNLDSKTGDAIMDLLLNLARDRSKTLLVVTHDARLARGQPTAAFCYRALAREQISGRYLLVQQPQLIGRDICKSFRMGPRRIEVLRGISMDIAHNETVFLSGASGAGKTTLLYTLAGLERPESGTVKFEGRELYSGSSSAEARLRNEKMGFVFQGYFLLHELTALENVLLPAMIGRRTTKGEAEESLAAVGLADRMHHLPAELSGGEQQRVAIARALTNDPDIIFADEPTGNLDSKTGDAIMDLLLNLARDRSKTLLVVTHDARLATRGDRQLHIMDGVLQ